MEAGATARDAWGSCPQHTDRVRVTEHWHQPILCPGCTGAVGESQGPMTAAVHRLVHVMRYQSPECAVSGPTIGEASLRRVRAKRNEPLNDPRVELAETGEHDPGEVNSCSDTMARVFVGVIAGRYARRQNKAVSNVKAGSALCPKALVGQSGELTADAHCTRPAWHRSNIADAEKQVARFVGVAGLGGEGAVSPWARL